MSKPIKTMEEYRDRIAGRPTLDEAIAPPESRKAGGRGMNETCFNCDFMHWPGGTEIHLDSKVECRRYAPRKIHGTGTGYDAELWPMVGMNDWCGEFRPKAARQEDGEL